mmetsp:Transcript_32021/g.76114  ORF Transcript_32021/g.76114 Transcript_32021/m.76114 type:complete len:164 (+) Transcript_32021:646-1137(+)
MLRNEGCRRFLLFKMNKLAAVFYAILAFQISVDSMTCPGKPFGTTVRAMLPAPSRVILESQGRSALRKLPGSRMVELRESRRTYEPARYNFQTCAVVGNGGALKSAKFGPSIDSHKTVFRINQAPTNKYEEYTGRLTTFRVLNKLWAAKCVFSPARERPAEQH